MLSPLSLVLWNGRAQPSPVRHGGTSSGGASGTEVLALTKKTTCTVKKMENAKCS